MFRTHVKTLTTQYTRLQRVGQLAKQTLKNGPQAVYSTSTGSDWEYLQRSIVPTDHFQDSLPRLAIPILKQTCENYLESQQVILSKEEWETTQFNTIRFMEEDGKYLHQELKKLDKNNKHTSYVSKPWFDMYLNSRLPIVLNFNPFVSFVDDPRPEYRTQLLRSTNMIVSSLRFLKSLRDNILEPDVYHLRPEKTKNEKFNKFCRKVPKRFAWHGAILHSRQSAFPLDMSQYDRLFNSTRIPKEGKDEFLTDPKARHMLLMRNGHFYVFDVLNSEGHIESPDKIMAHVQYILQDNQPPPEFPLGYFTAENRDTWAAYRDQLLANGNGPTLNKIDTALFALCLDDKNSDDPNDITRQFLHGDGINRWYDKSFSLIMTPDSKACVNFEHAWGDGVAVLRYFNEVFKDSTEMPFVHPSTTIPKANSDRAVQRLEFELDTSLKEGIQSAKVNFDNMTGSLDLHHLEYDTFTKDFVKSKKLSPDSIMQLAIQMAYYRQYRKFVATYESCSTAAYKHGRTETLRSATMHTKEATEMIVDRGNKESPVNLYKAMIQCSRTHGDLTKKAAMGQGFDRHLFALRTLAEAENYFPHKIFKDPAYTNMNHIILSTSTLSSPAVVIGGFAPVTPDGYGIGYSIESNRIGFNVTSYPPATNVREFIDCLRASLDDLFDIMNYSSPRNS
ncbi:carnitine O-palmitoyltransferase 2, mitochondrial-like [Mizuhopecten yessoensis]|uniref:Carnitine O-palmitoyltransferase 2, mitochondrial n=1 Tax=Mizuhopecten yessoensis TaxID=6573 RepID=A0A210QJ09_MIZYE|nr:carnitine O-palmitoyltransferase 2, mitochondrial-like [Mizuhopecten yessoensis]OWF48755.1 Carnitine O-palmitoyltransferase 2, mitochondrial [Mizuhopecten yessoensis]